MMDLIIAMTPYVDEKNIQILYDMALPWLQVCTCMFLYDVRCALASFQ